MSENLITEPSGNNIKNVIQQMIDDGKSQEFIEDFIEKYKTQKMGNPSPTTPDAVVEETAASDTESNLENTSSELPEDPNRDKLIQLESELEKINSDPKTMNSDENFRRKKTLRRQIKELGGGKAIKEIELEEVAITPQNDGSREALNLSRKKRLRDVTKKYFDNLDLNFNESSDDVNFDKSKLKDNIRNIYFNQSAEGEKFPFADPQYNKIENPRTGQIRQVETISSQMDPQQILLDQVFEDEFSKKIAEENSKAKAGSITIANQMMEEGTYAPHIESTFDNYFAPGLNKDQINNFELIRKNQNFKNIINNPNSTEEEIKNAQIERKKLSPLIKAANEKVGTPEEGGPYIDPITLEAVGTFEKDEIIGTFQPTKEYEKILANYKESTYETLERQFATWGLDQNDFEKTYNLNKTVDIKVDKSFIQEGSVAGEFFKNLGYEIENENYFQRQADVGTIKNVKYSDLYKVPTGNRFWKGIEILDENVNESTFINREDYKKEKLNLTLRQRALNDLFVLNLNPANEKIGFTDFLATAGKETMASFAGFLDRDNTQKFKNLIAPTKRERLDNLQDFLQTAQVPLSEEQKQNFKRSYAFELFGESLPGFGGDLIKFTGANKIAGLVGMNARMAALTKTNPMQAFMATNFLEGVKFSAVMADTDMFFNGFFFGAGSQAAAKILPKLGIINGVDLRPYQKAYEKVMGGGVGMAGGSEFEQFSHAVVNAAMRDKAFMTSMDELYGPQSDVGRRITLSLGMGKVLGGVKINARAELSRMSTRRKYLEEIQTKIDNGEYKGSELKEKQLLELQLRKDISVLDQQFNERDLGFQKKERDKAQEVVESRKIVSEDPVTGEMSVKRDATAAEIKDARQKINQYELNKHNAERDIKNYTNEVKKSGVFGENFKVEIKDGEGNMLGEGNKAEYDAANNTVRVDINKFRPGVFAQEVGHAMMKAAFGKNTKAAQIFKDKISETVNTKLKNERFKISEDKKGLTFEEAINEVYSKNKRPEEYVMNVVEFLSQPKYKHLLLENGIINDLKRSTVLMANRFRMDYSNKKNFTSGEELLEFLFSINKIAEGGSAVNLKNKFEAFRNIVVDGKKLYNKTTGKEIVKEEVQEFKNAASKDFSKEITPELQGGEKKSVLQAIKDLVPENIKTKADYDTWATGKGQRILGDAFSPAGQSNISFPKKGGPIFNYIRSGKTKAESDKTLMDVLERTMKFDPEAARKDGSKVGVEGFGERVFADSAWARLTSREALFKESEKAKQERSIEQNDFQIADNVVKENIKTDKISEGTPSYIQTNLKVNGKRITEKGTELRDKFIKEADSALEAVADLGFKPGDKGFRKALVKVIKDAGKKETGEKIIKKVKNKKTKKIEDKEVNETELDVFEKSLGNYDKFINENYNNVLTNKKALPLEFYVQGEKFTENPIFVKKSTNSKYKNGRATKQVDIREAIVNKKASYTENEAQGVLVYDRLSPTKAEGLQYFKIPNVKKVLIETLYKTNLVDAAINQSRTKKIYTTAEKRDIATKFQKEYDTYYSKELKADTEAAKASRLRERLLGEMGTFKDAKEEQKAYEDLIDKIDDVKVLEKLNTFFQTTNTVTYGNRYYTQKKTNKKYNGELKINASKGSFMINNTKEFTGPEAARNKIMFERGHLFDVAVLQKRIANKIGRKVEESKAIKHGKRETKAGPNKAFKNIPSEIKNNFKNETLTKESIQEYIDAAVKLYEASPRAAASLLYNQNASSGINRMLAKAIGYEIGTKPGNTSRYEHVLQNGEFNLLLKDIAEAKNPQSKEIMSDWLKENYRQLVITKATEKIVDATYNKENVVWKAKSELHPDVKADWNKVKNGDVNIKIRSANSRLFNDFFISEGKVIDPNKLITGQGKTFAEQYGVNVKKSLLNEQVIKEQYRLIKEIILDGKSVAVAKAEINKSVNILKQQGLNAKKISKGKSTDIVEVIKNGKAKNKIAKENEIVKFNSKDISGEFNSYLEKSTGIKKESIFGDATAMARGKRAKKDFGDYFIPVGAEDFAGLMHKTLAKGKNGEKQLEFYEKHLYDPYNKAVEGITQESMAMKNDFRALKKELSGVPKSLKEYTDSGAFTKEHAVRVAIWNKLGYEIPGISKKVKAELLKTIKNDAELSVFVNEIMKITKGDGYAKPENSWVGGNIAMDMVSLINGVKRTKHLEVWQNNADKIFSKENLNKLEAAYGKGYVTTLTRTLERMKTGSNRKWGGNETIEKWNDWVNGSVGAIMFLNTRSAVLQTISNINYINFSDNNPLQAAKAFGNQKQYWKDFKELFNSQYLQSRRGGNKINVNESELALAAEKGGMQGIVALMLNKGFVFTKIADSFAIASGGASMYRNRLNRYKKEGLSEKEATDKAFQDFMKITEETQQSSRPDRISEQQAGGLGRFMLAFANTPMQYNRIIKRNAQDLLAGRGNRAEKITKITYYSTIQNFIFNALQKALFAMAFSDEEEEAEIKRYSNIGNGMVDSLLRGSGLTGNAILGVKNIALDVADRMDRPQPNFQDAAWKALTVSPPLYSKATKLRGAGYSMKYVTKDNMFEPSLDNPALSAAAQTTSAAFNIPLDRALRKAQNVEAAMSDEAEYWQSTALLLGWGKWELGMDDSRKKNKKKKVKRDKFGFKTKTLKF